MKLLLCPRCQDIKKLWNFIQECKCGKSWGRYRNGIDAIYGGDAILLGFDNDSLVKAVKLHLRNKGNHTFKAFTIPENAKTITRISKTTKDNHG